MQQTAEIAWIADIEGAGSLKLLFLRMYRNLPVLLPRLRL
jgi:hypothetical protein